MALTDLRVGARVTTARGQLLSNVLRKLLANIDAMPAEHIRVNGDRVVAVNRPRSHGNAFSDGLLTLTNLAKFGQVSFPEHLWRAFRTYDLWLEPLLKGQWEQLSRDYLKLQGRQDFELSAWNQAFHSSESLGRDTTAVRARIIEAGFDQCVWTSRRFDRDFEVDHALPFAHWPCNQLWNLMPATKRANKSKLDKIPTAQLMSQRKPFILDWWKRAFDDHEQWHEPFWLEAQAGLPVIQDSRDPRDLFEAMCLQASRMRTEYALPTWSGT